MKNMKIKKQLCHGNFIKISLIFDLIKLFDFIKIFNKFKIFYFIKIFEMFKYSTTL